MEERIYWLWLTRIPGFGPRKIQRLLAWKKRPMDLFESTTGELREMLTKRPFNKGDLKAFQDSRNLKAIEGYERQLKDRGIHYITVEDSAYPEELYLLYEPVFVLYYRGIFQSHKLNIAMVGARNCSHYGRQVAEKLGEELAAQGVNVISGMALGIDSHSHIGALKGGGFTTAVLGNGVNVCYPKSNRDLMATIVKQGCVVSEYGPDMPPSRRSFPLRNRIIAALSQGVVLVEAKERSGSLITMDYALEYGRDVFAVPGDVLSRSNEGSNNIIRLGAKPVFGAKDILEEYSIYSNNERNCSGAKEFVLEEKEKIVYSFISLSPIHVDEVVRETGLRINELQFVLTKLEIKGAVIQLPNKYYIRNY